MRGRENTASLVIAEDPAAKSECKTTRKPHESTSTDAYTSRSGKKSKFFKVTQSERGMNPNDLTEDPERILIMREVREACLIEVCGVLDH